MGIFLQSFFNSSKNQNDHLLFNLNIKKKYGNGSSFAWNKLTHHCKDLDQCKSIKRITPPICQVMTAVLSHSITTSLDKPTFLFSIATIITETMSPFEPESLF